MNRDPKPRNLRPRPVVVVRPSFVSTENCYAIGGLIPRKFTEQVVPHCREVTRLGHTTLVPIDEFERVVRSLASTDEGQDIDLTHDDDDQPQTPEAVARALGREFAAS